MVESKPCWEDALSFEEDRAKPIINQYTFNYALKKLKEEHPFLKDYCHSQILQQKVMDLYEVFKKFFKGQDLPGCPVKQISQEVGSKSPPKLTTIAVLLFSGRIFGL